MAYCKNCGAELVENAKFCQKCGCSTGDIEYSKRQQEFSGKIYKCPNCGEVLKAFELNCPACGCELRGVKATSAVKEFALKLEAIEARRERENLQGWRKIVEAQQYLSKTDEQKISLIKSFSVPNTKEDMLEFMILATSNINVNAYESITSEMTKAEKALNAAWLSKVQQVYEKAKRSYFADDVFAEIEELYNQCNANIRKAKKKGISKWLLLISWIPIFIIVIFIVSTVVEPKAEKKEVERLEGIVVEVQQAIEAKEYKHALRIADTIDYQRYDVEMERKWDIQREYWVDKVREAANGNGVYLEYIPTPDIDKANDETNEGDTDGGFVEGVKEGIQPGLNVAKENVDEMNRIINGGETVNAPKEEQEMTQAETTPIETENVYVNNTIEKGACYTYGHDEGVLYCATAISDSVIKIEKWGKNFSTDSSFRMEYEVGAFKITDAPNEFTWIDDEHAAFSFVLTDEKEWDFRKSKKIVFTILGTDGDKNKGTNCNEKGVCYEYLNDDWHLYRAVSLTDELVKIECWYRAMAIGKFHYAYDVLLINQNISGTDFEWIDEERNAFTVSIKDEHNSNLKKSTFVVFEK